MDCSRPAIESAPKGAMGSFSRIPWGGRPAPGAGPVGETRGTERPTVTECPAVTECPERWSPNSLTEHSGGTGSSHLEHGNGGWNRAPEPLPISAVGCRFIIRAPSPSPNLPRTSPEPPPNLPRTSPTDTYHGCHRTFSLQRGHFYQDFHFGPGTVTGHTPAAPNTTSFRAEPCTSPPPVGARARPSAHRR